MPEEAGDDAMSMRQLLRKIPSFEFLLAKKFDFLKGRTVVMGCPKLDDYEFYLNKLTEIFKSNSIRKVEIVNMEVPCCFQTYGNSPR